MKMRPFGRLLRWDIAVARVLAATPAPSRSAAIALTDAVGRVPSRSVLARRPIPPFDRATWDGYACASAATRSARPGRPVRLSLVGELFADQERAAPVPRGACVAIATGARMPPGTDTVEIFEKVRRLRRAIEIDHPVARGRYVAERGDDMPAGTVLARAGVPLGPASLGALAAAGRTTVRVVRAPLVTIVPNGNELLAPGAPYRPGGIYESNNTALAAIVRAGGGIPAVVPPIPDDPRAIERALARAGRRSAIVVATGGSSVGEHDYLPRIFPHLGKLLFHGVAVRPGKPTLAARARSTLYLGMPGHPTSCLSNGFWLLLPAVRRAAGLPGDGWIEQEIRLARDAERRSPDLATVVPLRIEGDRGFPTFHDSHAITSLAGVDGYAIVPPGRAPLRRGDRLRVRRLLPPLGRAPGTNR